LHLSSVPLTQAVTSGDAGAVSAVLANGADVNERTGGGQTPLILATIFGHTHLIPLLLEAGADPQLRDKLGLNARDWAQRRGATEVLDVLNGKSAGASSTRFETTAPARPARGVPGVRPPRSLNPETEKPKSLSEEERSRRWLAGLKQRIAEQSQTEIPDGPNIFGPQREALAETQRKFLAVEREPHPEMPGTPAEPPPESPAPATPQPEIPALPQEPEPEIPIVPPDPELPKPPKPELPAETPKPELPGKSPTPELPTEPPTPEPGTIVAASSTAAEKGPRKPSARKRCPRCNAIYNSELVAYCAHHFVPLVDADIPIISEPHKPPAVMFWMIIVITLTGSIVVGSLLTAYFYTTKVTTQQTASAPPSAVQKGTPALGEELEGKAVSLPIAECPLNGQEAIPGTVVVQVVIDRRGQVKEAEASGGDWLLRGAAAQAAKKSTFAPDKLRGRETEGTITYTFEP
jgi:hypothetical protein